MTKLIRKRYLMYGYLEFYNYVNKIMERVPKGIPPERRAQIELQNLRNIFSGRLIIIDEAHNLRDIGSETETEDNLDAINVSCLYCLINYKHLSLINHY